MGEVFRATLLKQLKKEPIISSHCHHLPDEEHRGMNLRRLLENSYVGWCAEKIPDRKDKKAFAEWMRAVRTRSYFYWIERACRELYGIEEPLTEETWDLYDEAIRESHRDREWHLRILKEKCRYETIFLDTFWSPGDDNGHPELFKPAYRVNSIFYGYNQTARDHNDNNIQVKYGKNITDIEEYAEFVREILKKKIADGCSVFKCALAYDRTLAFEKGDKEKAQKALTENPKEADILAFQAYMFDVICETAGKLSVPVQIHTGLGLMNGTNAMQLQPLIARHPKTMFWLMHGSYPWINDIAGLAHVYNNVWVDLCWLPLISPTAAYRFLHEIMDVCNSDRIVWGCDTWTGEESYGARLAILELLAKVLDERVETGRMRAEDAWNYALGVLYRNAGRMLK